jgi:hypothetical protein
VDGAVVTDPEADGVVDPDGAVEPDEGVDATPALESRNAPAAGSLSPWDTVIDTWTPKLSRSD